MCLSFRVSSSPIPSIEHSALKIGVRGTFCARPMLFYTLGQCFSIYMVVLALKSFFKLLYILPCFTIHGCFSFKKLFLTFIYTSLFIIDMKNIPIIFEEVQSINNQWEIIDFRIREILRLIRHCAITGQLLKTGPCSKSKELPSESSLQRQNWTLLKVIFIVRNIIACASIYLYSHFGLGAGQFWP